MMIRQLFVTGFYACCISTADADFKLMDDPAKGTLTIVEDTSPVLSLRYGDQLPEGVDHKYIRSCYIHPVWSLDGQVLTDDFPEDHPHHHGIFWAWPKVQVRGQETQNWHPHDPPLRHEFVKWAEKVTDDSGSTVTMENRWLLDGKEEVARERVNLKVHPANDDSRVIDLSISIEAVGGPLKLQGTSEGQKGYGGFCWRASPDFTGAKITSDAGVADKDFVNDVRWWVDLSTSTSGIAIIPTADYPHVPPNWMARNSYAGFVNISWPGLDPFILETGKSVTLRHRLIVHDGKLDLIELDRISRNYIVGDGFASTRD